MVNRVFCYSDAEASKNGNSFAVGKLILILISVILISFLTLGILAATFTESFLNNTLFFSLLISFFMVAIVIYIAFKYRLYFRPQLKAFATDTNNNVYYVEKLNNGESFVIGGMATGGIIDRILDDSNSFAGNIAEGIGSAMTIYSLHKSAKIMQNPEIIAKMVEYATTTTGAEVKQILKVYNYTQNSHSVKIKCDYRIMRTGKIQYNKNLVIYKSFNCFNDLMNTILNTSRRN